MEYDQYKGHCCLEGEKGKLLSRYFTWTSWLQNKLLTKSNAESGTGYSDILVEVPDNRTGIVVELKYAEDGDMETACAKALTQIDEKNLS